MNVQPYEVEFLKKASQIPDDLWEACFPVPGEGRWWYEALEQSGIDDQFSFLYGLIKHLGYPVGIAPAFAMDMPVEQVAPRVFLRPLRLIGKIVPSVLRQRTLFVGSPILDESRVGLIPHINRRAALLALQIALEAKAGELRASLIVWKDFPESWIGADGHHSVVRKFWASSLFALAIAAWSTIQQLVQSLESAVQSKNLHGIHEPSMKIRAPIRSLKQHCSTLSVDISKKMTAALKQLDNSITDLHSAADEGNQKEAESSLKEVEAAFDQLKSLDPDTAFKSVVH